MPTVTKLVGPIKTERYRYGLAWVFVGTVMINDTEFVRRWKLYFYFDTRRYVCKARRPVHGDEQMEHKDLWSFGRLPQPLTGKVTPMLRARLTAEHIAEATRLALDYRG